MRRPPHVTTTILCYLAGSEKSRKSARSGSRPVTSLFHSLVAFLGDGKRRRARFRNGDCGLNGSVTTEGEETNGEVRMTKEEEEFSPRRGSETMYKSNCKL